MGYYAHEIKVRQTLSSFGYIEKIVKLENGSAIIYLRDTINNIRLEKIINFEETNLQEKSFVNINYSLISEIDKGLSSDYLQFSLEPITMERNSLLSKHKIG